MPPGSEMRQQVNFADFIMESLLFQKCFDAPSNWKIPNLIMIGVVERIGSKSIAPQKTLGFIQHFQFVEIQVKHKDTVLEAVFPW